MTDLKQTIADTIAAVQEKHCSNCQAGKALVSLRNLIDAPKSEPGQPEVSAPKAKMQRLAKKAKPSAGGSKKDAILAYLRNHPGSSAVEIAKALGINRGAANYNLTAAKRAGLISLNGSTLNAKYTLAKQTPDTKTPPPSSEEEPETNLECKFCHAPCASQERLDRHMRLVHNR